MVQVQTSLEPALGRDLLVGTVETILAALRSYEVFGHTARVELRINVEGAAPILQRPCRVPIHRRQLELEWMLDKRIIEPTKGPWASPVVLVQKRDVSWRFCVDYWWLNMVTQKDAYPLREMDNMLILLWLAQYFFTLDLVSGYWRVVVAEGDWDKTAFCTQQGL